MLSRSGVSLKKMIFYGYLQYLLFISGTITFLICRKKKKYSKRNRKVYSIVTSLCKKDPALAG
jgi:hypothetical protein